MSILLPHNRPPNAVGQERLLSRLAAEILPVVGP